MDQNLAHQKLFPHQYLTHWLKFLKLEIPLAGLQTQLTILILFEFFRQSLQY